MKKSGLFLPLLLFLSINLFAQVPNYVPTNGLVGWWPFNGNANDLSGNGNNGTVNGATLVSDRFGNTNNAYSFDGVNDYIHVANSASIGSNITNQLTISVWSKINGFPFGFAPMISKDGPVYHQYEFFTEPNLIGFWSTNIYTSTPSSNSLNTWNLFTVTFNNGTVKYYKNGVLIFTTIVAQNTTQPSSNSNLEFGADSPNGAQYLQGQLDDIGIWNIALTQQEIVALYTYTPNTSVAINPTSTTICSGLSTTLTATPTGSTPCSAVQLPTNLQSGLVGYWPFCGNAIDASGNGNNGTVNGATLTTDRFGTANSAYSNPGGNSNIQISGGSLDNQSSLFIGGWFNAAATQYGVSNIFQIDANSPCSMYPGQTSNPNNNIYLRYDNGTSSFYYSFQINNVIATYTLPVIPTLNTWHQFGINYNGSIVEFYLDGTIVSSLPMSGVFQSFGQAIHLANWCNIEDFDGLIDDFILYQRALTAAEIQQLYTQGQATYAWSPGGATTPSITVSPASTTTYTCTATVNGSTNSSTSTVTVNPIPIANAGADSTITCYNNLTGYQLGWIPEIGNTYSWSPTIGLSNPNIANPIANPSVTTTYTLTVTNSFGCSANDQATATVNTTTSAITVSPNVTICQGNSASIYHSPLPAGSYWVGGWQTWTQDTIVVTPASVGQHTYTCYSSNGCSSASVVVTVVENPQINAGPDQTICSGSSVILSASGATSYSWTGGIQNGVPFIPAASGQYFVSGTNSFGCTGNDAVNITLIPNPIITTTNDTICPGDSTTLTLNNFVSNQSNCIGNPGSPNPWPFPSAANGGYIPLGTFGSQNVFSISMWINPAQVQNSISIILDASHGGSSNWVIQTLNSGSTWTWGTGVFMLTPNTWQHLLLTYNNGSRKIFINGIQVQSWTQFISYSGSPALYLGNWPEGGRRFNGLIDELYITNDIQYTSNFTPLETIQTSSPQSFGLWHFDEGSGLSTNNLVNSNFPLNNWYWATRPLSLGYSLNWNPGGATTPSITVSPNNSTTYTCSITTNGVTCSSSQTIFVNPAPTLNAGPDQTICSGSSVTLSATGATSYSWTGGVQNGVPFNPSASGQYIVSGTNTLGCVGIDTVNVTLIPNPIITTSNDTICSGQSVILSTTSNSNCSNFSGTLANGLVGYWPFCGNFDDVSGYGHFGTNYGATFTSDRFGNANNSIYLNGSSRVDIGNLNLGNSSNSYTYSNWFRTSASSAPHRTMIADYNSSSGDDNIFACWQMTESTNQASTQTRNGTTSYGAFSNNPVNDGQWHHIATTINRVTNLISIYIDGVLINSTTIPANINFNENGFLRFGIHKWNNMFQSNLFWLGELDDIGIWNRALTSAEILQLYTLGQATYSWTPGGATTQSITVSPSSTTTYTCTVTDVNGNSCSTDQTITVNPAPASTISANGPLALCPSQNVTLCGPISPNMSYYWCNGAVTSCITANLAGTYCLTVLDSNGCYSDTSYVVVSELQSSSSNTIITECNSYTLNGQTYNQTGVYTQSLQNVAGCDSTITLDLTINSAPGTPNIYVQNQTTLATDDILGLSYQWFFCTDLIDVPGATNAVFTPTSNAYYAVIVSNNCGTDTSACIDVNSIGLYEIQSENFQVYPNPTDDNFYIRFDGIEPLWIEIMDINGRIIIRKEINQGINPIDISNVSRGTYWITSAYGQPIQIVKN